MSDIILKMILTVSQEKPLGGFYVSDDKTSMFGEGTTLLVALENYISSLREYYSIIERSALDGNIYCQEKLIRLQELLGLDKDEEVKA